MVYVQKKKEKTTARKDKEERRNAKRKTPHLDLHRPQIRRDLLQHLIRLRSPTHPGALIRIRIQTQQTRRRSLSFLFLDPLRRFLFREVVGLEFPQEGEDFEVGEEGGAGV